VFKLLEVLRLRRSWAVEAGIQRGAMNREAVTEFETSSISYSVARLVVNILAFFIISTAAVYSVSNQLSNSFIISTSEEESLSFGNALYFCIVTITTVGYGEILPGQLFCAYVQVLVHVWRVLFSWHY
jgi:CBS domain containing-hemolysin-like protein